MKTTLLAIAVLLLAVNSAAQRRMATADVPFNFVANGAVLPAGHYSIMSSGQTDSALILRNTDSGKDVLVLFDSMPSARANAQTRLIFTRTNGEYLLHSVSVQGGDHIHDLLHGSDVVQPETSR